MACGGEKTDDQLLPPPSPSSQVGSSRGGAGGSAASATCPAYRPDPCPATDGADASCVSLQDDAKNCGACGKACEAQAACVAGKCGEAPKQLVAAEQCGDVRLTLHGDRLFWNEPMSGKVRSTSISGGDVTELAANQAGPGQVTVDETTAYWAVAGDGSPASSGVAQVALSPPGVAFVSIQAPGTDPVTGVVAAGGKLYYGLVHDIHAFWTEGSLGHDEVVGVAVARNDTRVPYGIPNALTVHSDRVYWIVTDVGSVESDDLLPGADGYARIGHSGQMWPNDVGFAGDYAYYAAFGSLYAAQANQPAVAVASISDGSLAAFAIAETTAYFSDDAGRLFRHGLELPGPPSFEPTPSLELAQDQGKITSVVVDEAHVFWAAVGVNGDCTIRALPL